MANKEQIVVTAAQMRQLEERIFDYGMPIAALMEKAALLSAEKITCLYPLPNFTKVGILVGPGHNGGDALVIGRELSLAGYQVTFCCPFSQVKELTQKHLEYAKTALKLTVEAKVESIVDSDLLIDGCFGFGLTRPISGELAEEIEELNQAQKPVVSIDLPSGIHTDTGEILGIAVKATHTLCLGLWKQACYQDQALEYLGEIERIDFGIPETIIQEILAETPPVKIVTPAKAREFLPLPRPLVTHKYKQGHLLLICGSARYAGGAILTGLGARGSGVGMLSIAVPKSLKPILVSHLPEALIIACPETNSGAIASIPTELEQYQAIACGPGLTTEAESVVKSVIELNIPLVLDADALNILNQAELMPQIQQRQLPTILTPHLGEFKRLFPQLPSPMADRISSAVKAAKISHSIVLLKGTRTVIATPEGKVWIIPKSTPALARGGSGDVLTGLIGGLIAPSNHKHNYEERVAVAAWWHSQAGITAAQDRTELGVDAFTLTQYLVRLSYN